MESDNGRRRNQFTFEVQRVLFKPLLQMTIIIKQTYITSTLSSIFKSTMRQSRSLSTTADDVLVSTINKTGILQLNRPKVLNCLNLSMVNKIHDALKEWENSKHMVIISGTGGKAFSAGGDAKRVAETGLRGESYGRDFFRREYTLNGIIGTYRLPYIALIDGIVMGGGAGVSIHGRFRVATEKTLFAMPETRIGLFPDAGGSYYLPRLDRKLGYYLALTGKDLQGSDVYKAGIATHYCKSSDIKELQNTLTSTCNNAEDIKSVLHKFHIDDQRPLSLDPYLEKINKYFSLPTMEAIVEALEQDGSGWAKDTVETLTQMSPTSLKITLKQMKLGKNLDLHECLRMEYRLAVNCMANKDLYEGIRALLVDKDNQPKWKPSKLTEVSDAMVDSYFKELPKLEELQHKL